MKEIINYMNQHKFIWTLQSNFPNKWKSKLSDNNLSLEHIPLVELVQTGKLDAIIPSLKDLNIIISSPFAAKIVCKKISNNYNFYVVGNKSKEILEKSGFNVLKCLNTSKELSNWLKVNKKEKLIHLCSEMSDNMIWPKNVISYPFYKPVDNNDFNADLYKNLGNCTIVFGSPSGVDVWFKNIKHKPSHSYACMGETTATKISDYTNKNILFPEDSSIETLLRLITKKKYEH